MSRILTHSKKHNIVVVGGFGGSVTIIDINFESQLIVKRTVSAMSKGLALERVIHLDWTTIRVGDELKLVC